MLRELLAAWREIRRGPRPHSDHVTLVVDGKLVTASARDIARAVNVQLARRSFRQAPAEYRL